jgi:hypothetical protein
VIGGRRIIARDELYPSMRHPIAALTIRCCSATLVLDRTRYRCLRDHVDGIHDAFREHGDGGAVRW